ncbi:MAG: hypothetical protein MZV63_54320 [Marinilabiliales bacterium]|nr:hypothetical protein [Marinilabiliales bacterium]
MSRSSASADQTESKLEELKKVLSSSEAGIEGVVRDGGALRYIWPWNRSQSEVELDLSLARGLNYYTGAIIEVKAADVSHRQRMRRRQI